MAGKTAQRRQALRDRLIDIAEDTIARDGMAAIKARDLAKQADCALGAIYNVFDDLNDIVIAVNGRTFRRLGRVVANVNRAASPDAPVEQLIAMSDAYLQFAIDHPKLWRSLFDLRISGARDVPAWYLEELMQLFSEIAGPLAKIFPEKTPRDLDLIVRTLFSAVHGIVLLGVEDRASGVPRADLQAMIALLLHRFTFPDAAP